MSKQQEAQADSWRLGIVGAWYLRDDQIPIYRFISSSKRPFVECARRYGKTTTILIHVLEELRRNRGWVCRWCEPLKNQAREIVMPEMDKLQKNCPDHLKFHYQTTDSVYIGPGNSRIYLRGVNEDKGESARGPFANIIVADEYGSWRDPEYITQDVLAPQLLTTRGQLIKASTPPRNLGHAYYTEKAQALSEERFIQRIIYDNKSLSDEDIEQAAADAGGKDSSAWRREYLCEPVADIEDSVIPEFSEAAHVIDSDTVLPAYYDAYVGADGGFHDHSAFLFAHYDFAAACLVIDDEIFVKGQSSKELTDMAKQKEHELYGKEPYRRTMDAPPQQLHDMSKEHDYKMLFPLKDDKFAAVNNLRLLFTQNRIKIKSRCKSLIFQLKVGMWNDRKTDFERGDAIGHLDSIAALVYLARSIDFTKNPYPKYDPTFTEETHFIPNELKTPQENEVWFSAFGKR